MKLSDVLVTAECPGNVYAHSSVQLYGTGNKYAFDIVSECIMDSWWLSKYCLSLGGSTCFQQKF